MRLIYASDYAYGVNPDSPALIITQGFTGTGAQSAIVQGGSTIVNPRGERSVAQPLATNALISVGAGATIDSVTPSAVSYTTAGQAQFTATFTYAHGNGTVIASGTIGLQEALNDLSNNGGGAVIVDGRWAQLGGTSSIITASTVNGSGSSQCFILDYRGSSLAQYSWNGSAWASAGSGLLWAAGANGQSFTAFVNTENITLSTTGLTTDSSANLLPANSIILAVTGTISAAITGGNTTNWQLGDASTAGRFSAVDTTLTLAESVPKANFPPVQIGTGVASATTGVYQAAAAKVRITTTGTGNPTGGKIRVTVYGFTLVNATS